MIKKLENKLYCILKKLKLIKNQKNIEKVNCKISCLGEDIDQIDYFIDDIIYSIKNIEKKN